MVEAAVEAPPDGRRGRRPRAVAAGLAGLALLAAVAALAPFGPASGRGMPAEDEAEPATAPEAPAARAAGPGEGEAVPAWRPAWSRSGRFDLPAPRWRPLGASSAVLRRGDGLSRELFLFGEPAGARRHAALAVDLGMLGPAAPADDIRALAADLGVAARVGAREELLETKFGPLPLVDVVLDGPAGPKACLGYVLRSAEARLRLSGWVCNGGPEIVSRGEARCLVDRLVAVGAGEPALAALFVQAELRRGDCNASGRQAAEAAGARLRLRTAAP